jgi:hypothetical protein
MRGLALQLAAAAAISVLYVLFAWAKRRLERSRPVRPGPSTPDLRDEPPAVVNLLVRRNIAAPQAASATLLDLAARRVVEIFQTADDPEHTIIRRRADPPADLRPYERRVLDRIQHVGRGQPVTAAELAARYADGGLEWHRWLVREATMEARARGLTRRPSDSPMSFTVGLLVAGVLVFPLPEWSLVGLLMKAVVTLFLGVFCMLFLSVVAFNVVGRGSDRYTARGREAAAHWLGVGTWLRAHPTLQDVPPSAVALWDRYLAYGAALDAVNHAVRVVDLAQVGLRDEFWSEHTGQRRLVRVRHFQAGRRPLHPLGQTRAAATAVWSGLMLPLWLGLGLWLGRAVDASPYWRYPVLALAALQVGRHAFRFARALIDRKWPTTVTGTLLDISVAGQKLSADESVIADFPKFYYLVVDDGSADTVRPWLVDGHRAGNQVHRSATGIRVEPSPLRAGDRVRVVAERWSRFVNQVTVEVPVTGR